ncbi:glycosyltransferase family 2 protein [Granulicella arctica]|uniref:glycosyltransferase family 2 protein n=1 Tax=Granulicella arctica TaxID=940613 RepID=UPI0021E09893|nr:glycosyltransferase family 2 protein [Granulicella arctica]
MSNPTVSFVVPCYRLAHLLKECVDSILLQTYSNLEVLIMDDVSPDHTAEVALSFRDDRVRYIRNPQNLGHLKNYNAGISLSKGDYIWLISADDYLKSPQVLERYVTLLEKFKNVGYAFCPGTEVRSGAELEVLKYSIFAKNDCVVSGRRFVKSLLEHNFVVAASVLVRRSCYEDISMFPISGAMEWSGDWYLWCRFALEYDVAYFAESMVCYRAHEGSMTQELAKVENLHKCSEGDLAIPLMMRLEAQERHLESLERDCLRAVAKELVRQCLSKKYQGSQWSLTSSEIEAIICDQIPGIDSQRYVRAKVFEGFGDRLWKEGQRTSAAQFYRRSILQNPVQLLLPLKMLLLGFGVPRSLLAHVRMLVAGLRAA